ncbi:efflux ABC transporter, permease protein [Actinomyces sp. Chiba101]|nr:MULTISPECIES: ABC transporter permease [Actinomyces]BAW92766.1 efflux ABC transporter, permease protein [Actinomyces sp. Chiba101]GAV94266.1 ABC transporter, permease protein [Actinomyces denticolens]SUU07183.1 FtsX-like permease family [Actinomyces denticolens]
MLRLALTDLRRNAGQWLWSLIIVAVAGACSGAQMMITRGALAAARAAGDENMIEGARVFQGWTLTAVSLSAITILTIVAALVVRQRERAHGLWRALGMRPRVLRAILLGQLAVVGALGALVGQAGAYPLARLLRPMLVEEGIVLPGAGLVPSAGDLPLLVVLAIAVSALGGLGATRRSTRAEVVSLLRGLDERRERRWRLGRAALRGTCVLGCLVGVVAAAVSAAGAEPETERAIVTITGGAFGALGAVLLAAPWLVPVVERAWTALIPARAPAWFLARRAAAHQAGRSAATVIPFTVASGLVGMFYPMKIFGASGVTPTGLFSMFGPALIVAWTGGVAVIAMGAARRRRDAALLVAAGSRPGQVRAAQALEGVIHAVTTTLLGAIIAVAVQIIGYITWDRTVPAAQVARGGPWGELGALGAATLLVIALAIVASSALLGRSAVETLRARD